MVRNIAAIVAVVIIVAGGIALEIYMEHTLDKLEEHITAIEKDGQFSLEKAEQAMDWWDKKTKILAMFISHDPLHEIDDYLAEIKGAIIFDPQSARPALEKALSAKDNMLDQHKLSFSNIF
ncbi:MAG: DUF4363 family protein [Christensenellales bacterium]|jgi:hypothetical protein